LLHHIIATESDYKIINVAPYGAMFCGFIHLQALAQPAYNHCQSYGLPKHLLCD